MFSFSVFVNFSQVKHKILKVLNGKIKRSETEGGGLSAVFCFGALSPLFVGAACVFEPRPQTGGYSTQRHKYLMQEGRMFSAVRRILE